MFPDEGSGIFQDRAEAGRELAQKLQAYANRQDVIVLGIPRGGVLVACEVAKALRAPLDIFVSRKLGVPGQEELAFGAVASGGVRILDQEIIEEVVISEQQVEAATRRARQELERRESLYRGARPPVKIEGRTVLLVDDGIATGASIHAAIKALRQLKPARIVVAAPVCPLSTSDRLKGEVEETIFVETPKHFYAIGQFYQDFSEVSDEQVTESLRSGAQPALQGV